MKALIALGVCLASVLGIGLRPAAGQMVDIITVTLPTAATVGKVTLPAGVYTIRDLKEDGSTPVLEIRSASGPSVTASVTQISVPNRKFAPQTAVVLRHEGNQYQIDKIWIEGRDYGYDLHPATPGQR
jgi:hypothetical protein